MFSKVPYKARLFGDHSILALVRYHILRIKETKGKDDKSVFHLYRLVRSDLGWMHEPWGGLRACGLLLVVQVGR